MVAFKDAMNLRTYYEVVKPERTLANVLTTAAGFLLACAWRIDVGLFIATVVGTTLIVASACAVNNLTDRRIDARMPRTKRRALVVGTLPVGRVVGLAVVLGVGGFGLLVAYVNWLTVLVGVVGYVDYVILYAWTKRRTVHSTLVGTISGAAPLVAGYVAVTDRLDLTALLLALIMVFWQMAHFFAIGIYRVEDYRAGSLPIFSVIRGVANTERQIVMYIVLFLLAVAVLPFGDGVGRVFSIVMLPVALYWLWGAFQPAKNSDDWGRSMFGTSLIVLLILCAVLSLGSVLP
jgi:protoheme IX farnesyltransferase